MAFNWAVIGSGVIAHRVLGEITKTGRHRLCSVWSRNMDSAQKLAEKFGGRAYASLEEALAAPGVQGAYIATPNSAHISNALGCLKAGVPVLCEKPAVLSAAQLSIILDAAERADTYFCEGMWTRFMHVTQAVRRAAESGEIGKIKSINLTLSYDRRFSGFSGRVTDPMAGGGALLDVGVYCAAYAVMLLGEPQSITSRSKLKGGVDMFTRARLNYSGGAYADITAGIDRLLPCRAVIKGESGKITVPMFFKPVRARVIPEGGGAYTVRGQRGFLPQFDKVAEDILSGKKQSAEMPHTHSLAVMKILDECRRQAGIVYPGE